MARHVIADVAGVLYCTFSVEQSRLNVINYGFAATVYSRIF